jgi:peroxin-2
VEAVHTTLGLIGFIVFLYDGRSVHRQTALILLFLIPTCDRCRTIADRLLGLKLVPSRSIVRRNVSFEFMNRQMVWHAFTVRTKA